MPPRLLREPHIQSPTPPPAEAGRRRLGAIFFCAFAPYSARVPPLVAYEKLVLIRELPYRLRIFQSASSRRSPRPINPDFPQQRRESLPQLVDANVTHVAARRLQ